MSKPAETYQTWKRCDHKNGVFMVARFWWFKKRYFVCFDCRQAIDGPIYDLLANKATPTRDKGLETKCTE